MNHLLGRWFTWNAKLYLFSKNDDNNNNNNNKAVVCCTGTWSISYKNMYNIMYNLLIICQWPAAVLICPLRLTLDLVKGKVSLSIWEMRDADNPAHPSSLWSLLMHLPVTNDSVRRKWRPWLILIGLHECERWLHLCWLFILKTPSHLVWSNKIVLAGEVNQFTFQTPGKLIKTVMKQNHEPKC